MLIVFGDMDILTGLVFTALVVLWGRGYFRDLVRKFARHLTGRPPE